MCTMLSQRQHNTAKFYFRHGLGVKKSRVHDYMHAVWGGGRGTCIRLSAGRLVTDRQASGRRQAGRHPAGRHPAGMHPAGRQAAGRPLTSGICWPVGLLQDCLSTARLSTARLSDTCLSTTRLSTTHLSDCPCLHAYKTLNEKTWKR